MAQIYLAVQRGPGGFEKVAVLKVILPELCSNDDFVKMFLDEARIAANIDHVAMPPMPAGAKQAMQNLDGFTGIGYQGPCPQAVNSRQTYVFKVWAIGVATLPGVTSTSTTVAAQTAIKNAALAGGSATLSGTQIQTP